MEYVQSMLQSTKLSKSFLRISHWYIMLSSKLILYFKL
jgi:hypothetical protein